MQSPVHGRCCIDIKSTYIKHSSIILELLAIHAISGCDSVAATYGTSKATALTISSKGHKLNLLGNMGQPEIMVVTQQSLQSR